MSIFQRDHYQSDATLVIDALKKNNPKLEEQQQAGRALLWDKAIDAQMQAEYKAGRVAQSPYVYQTK